MQKAMIYEGETWVEREKDMGRLERAKIVAVGLKSWVSLGQKECMAGWEKA